MGNVGGGKYPIVGCISGKQEAIHHGPEKIPKVATDVDRLRLNKLGNVHRICHRCHQLWHTWNDGDYTGEAPFVPHAPINIDLMEVIKWSQNATRPKPPVARKGNFVRKDVQELPDGGGSSDGLEDGENDIPDGG